MVWANMATDIDGDDGADDDHVNMVVMFATEFIFENLSQLAMSQIGYG